MGIHELDQEVIQSFLIKSNPDEYPLSIENYPELREVVTQLWRERDPRIVAAFLYGFSVANVHFFDQSLPLEMKFLHGILEDKIKHPPEFSWSMMRDFFHILTLSGEIFFWLGASGLKFAFYSCPLVHWLSSSAKTPETR